jgi:hypothetical protein
MAAALNPPRNGEGDRRRRRGWRVTRPMPYAVGTCPATSLRLVPLPVPGRIA